VSEDISKFVVRIPANLHERIKMLADRDNRSMNNYIIKVLEEHIVKQQIESNDSLVMERTIEYNSSTSDDEIKESIESIFNLIEMKVKEKYNKNTSEDN
jgi:hypothetical protein